jgi:hypothetical protein
MVTEIFETPGNVTTFPQQLQYFNSLTDVGFGGILGIAILILIGAVLFLMMKGFGNERAFSVTGIILGVLGLFLWIMKLINSKVFTICIIILVVGILMLIKEAANFES